MNELIILSIVLVIIALIVISFCFCAMQNKLNSLINKSETYTDDDEMLMIRYNYVINLKKLESFTKELLNSNIDNKLINYIKEYTNKINNYIYDDKTYTKTVNFENEMLYKNEIINLDVVFYAYNHLFSILDKPSLKILNSKSKLKKEIEKKDKNFKKSLKTYKKKSQNIIKDKNNIDRYYLRIEEMKNIYKEFINKLNPIFTILFIKYSIDVINEKSDIN